MASSEQSVRRPAVAGRFYPDEPAMCKSAVAAMMATDPQQNARAAEIGALSKPCGGIVPHAGWICSGKIAGEAIATLASLAPADVVVVFGAVHTPIVLEQAALDPHAMWQVPTGDSAQPHELIQKLARDQKSFVVDSRLHDREHAVEVELPLIQAAWPGAMVLPIEVPLKEDAERVGRETAQQVLSEGKRAVFLASSDLTHYGPNYRFAPAGVGIQGLTWAKENDRRLLDLIEGFAIERIVPEVKQRYNACGGGAIAATMAACKEFGASRAKVLRHANSYETLMNIVGPDPTNAVGYAGVVIG